MLLSETVSQDIVAAGLDAIEISLDGQSPEQNNIIRRNCNYGTVISNTKALIACKKQLQSDTPQIFIASTQFLDPKSASGHEDPKPPDYLLEEFSGEYATEIRGFKSTWAMRWPHMEVLDEIFDLYQEPGDSEIRNACDHVENTVTIGWNGDVVSCCYDLTSRFVLGNIHQDDLSAIWNNKRYLGLRQSIAKMKFIPLCANCAVVKPKIFLLLKPDKHEAMDNGHNLKGR
jgi:radical SAM protein with 4Fe4S-binding SPASM domain